MYFGKFQLKTTEALAEALNEDFIKSLNFRVPLPMVREALEVATPEAFRAARDKGFDGPMSVVVAAYPEQEDRLGKIKDSELAKYPELWASEYDIDKIIALSETPSLPSFTHPYYIIPVMEKGFTVEEAGLYGAVATNFATREELESLSVDVDSFRKLSQIFNGIKGMTETLTVAHVEALVQAGFINGREYRDYSYVLGAHQPTLAAVERVTKARIYLNLEELTELKKFTRGEPAQSVIEDMSKIIKLGHSIEDYFRLKALTNTEAEDAWERRNSPSASIVRILAAGFTEDQVKELTASGKALAEIAPETDSDEALTAVVQSRIANDNGARVFLDEVLDFFGVTREEIEEKLEDEKV